MNDKDKLLYDKARELRVELEAVDTHDVTLRDLRVKAEANSREITLVECRKQLSVEAIDKCKTIIADALMVSIPDASPEFVSIPKVIGRTD